MLRKTPLRKSPLKRSAFKPKGKTSIERLLGEGIIRKANTMKPLPNKGKDEWSKALKEADTAFSRLVRVRAAGETGIVHCFICEQPVPWSEAHLMHVFTRKKMSVRFHGFNRGGCMDCNLRPLGDRARYLERLSHVFGPEEVQDFIRLSNETVKYTSQELRRMAKEWNQQADELVGMLP